LGLAQSCLWAEAALLFLQSQRQLAFLLLPVVVAVVDTLAVAVVLVVT